MPQRIGILLFLFGAGFSWAQSDFLMELKSVKSVSEGEGASLELVFETTFPESIALSAQPLLMRHEYSWVDRSFNFAPSDPKSAAFLTPVSSKRAVFRRVHVPSNGYYQLQFWYDPATPGHPQGFEKKFGGKKNAYRRDFPRKHLMVGDVALMLKNLGADGEKAEGLIEKVVQLVKKFEGAAGSSQWENVKTEIEEEANKINSKALGEVDTSLHAATFKALADFIMFELLVSLNAAQQLLDARANPAAASSGGPDDGMHKPGGTGPTSKPLEPGTKFTFDLLHQHARYLQTVRMLEFFAWITLFEKDGFEKLAAAYDLAKRQVTAIDGFKKARNEMNTVTTEIEKAMKSFKENARDREEAESILTLWDETPFSEALKRVSTATALLSEDVDHGPGEPSSSAAEARQETAKLLTGARDKALGKRLPK